MPVSSGTSAAGSLQGDRAESSARGSHPVTGSSADRSLSRERLSVINPGATELIADTAALPAHLSFPEISEESRGTPNTGPCQRRLRGVSAL